MEFHPTLHGIAHGAERIAINKVIKSLQTGLPNNVLNFS